MRGREEGGRERGRTPRIIWPTAWRTEKAPKVLPVSVSPRACMMQSASEFTAGTRPAPNELSAVAPTKSAWPSAGPAVGDAAATRTCARRSTRSELRMRDMSKRISFATSAALGLEGAAGWAVAAGLGLGLGLNVKMTTGGVH